MIRLIRKKTGRLNLAFGVIQEGDNLKRTDIGEIVADILLPSKDIAILRWLIDHPNSRSWDVMLGIGDVYQQHVCLRFRTMKQMEIIKRTEWGRYSVAPHYEAELREAFKIEVIDE